MTALYPFPHSPMENSTTSPATQTYCVWADCFARCYQEIEATSPEEAYRIARDDPDGWEFCSDAGDNRYSLSDQVGDTETGETFRIEAPGPYCRTCGSEIVETVNEGAFRDGECNGCEYERYKSQPALLAACFRAYGELCDLAYHRCFRWWPRRFQEANEVMDELAKALNDYGKES